MLEITLYTKNGCGLCEEVKHELAQLQTAVPHHLTEVDITKDEALFATYRYRIPVLQIGTKTLAAPISQPQLAAWLAEFG